MAAYSIFVVKHAGRLLVTIRSSNRFLLATVPPNLGSVSVSCPSLMASGIKTCPGHFHSEACLRSARQYQSEAEAESLLIIFSLTLISS